MQSGNYSKMVDRVSERGEHKGMLSAYWQPNRDPKKIAEPIDCSEDCVDVVEQLQAATVRLMLSDRCIQQL